MEEISNNLLSGKSQGALFIGVLRSHTVENALIQEFDLRKVYGIRRWMDTRKKLEGRTEITEDRKSKIIEIRVLDRSPKRAQALARAYVEELNRAVNALSTSSARREREFLEGRLVAVKQDLDQASRDFSKFASQNTAIDVPEQGKAMVQAAAVLQGELIAAEAEEQGLKQIYTENNVRVRSLDGRIEELRRKLKEVGDAGTGADAGNSSELYPSIRKLPLLGVTYFDLYRKFKVQEAVFEALTKRYEIAKVEEAKEIPTVRELDPADLPEKKASPSRAQIVIAGVIFSLVAGCFRILGDVKWKKIDTRDRRKLLILQIASDLSYSWSRLRARAARLVSKQSAPSNFE
jgi:capsule polysaccharide export protein KpsE/RkpR